MTYHNYVSTEYIYRELYYQKEQLNFLREQIIIFEKKLKSYSPFNKLDKGKQKFILKGKNSTIFSHYEIIEKRQIDLNKFMAYYKLTSNHTHSSPLAFNHISTEKVNNVKDNFEYIELALLLDYCSSHFATIIKTVMKLWKIPYANNQNELIIEDYIKFKGI